MPNYGCSGAVEGDARAIDLNRFPKMRDLKIKMVTQRKGDCMYIPYGHLHQVSKVSKGFSVGVSYLWERDVKYSPQICQFAPKTNIPLQFVIPLWFFSGKGVVPLGYSTEIQMRDKLLDLFESNPDFLLSLAKWKTVIQPAGYSPKGITVEGLFAQLDTDASGGVSEDEVLACPVKLLLEIC